MTPAGNDDLHPLDRILEEFSALVRRGEPPTVEEYTARYPEFASELRTLLPTAAAMEDLVGSSATTSEAPPLPIDLERLGDFHILGILGRGGMGIVYEAEQESLHRRVAVKVLPATAVPDESRQKRFHSEARTAASLHHTHIVPIFGTGSQDGHHYYVMQFIRGLGMDKVLRALRGEPVEPSPSTSIPFTAQDAARRLEEGAAGPRPAGIDPYSHSVARLGAQAARALHHAHSQGILHRDVKPANLLLDDHGQVWIADFGLAVALDPAGSGADGDVVGTLRYMAPEQIRGQASACSDVYGLGLTLFELVARCPAFAGRGRSGVLEAIRTGTHPALSEVAPDLPPDLAAVVEKACAADPEQRYPTALALAEDLERILTDRPVLARPVGRLVILGRWCRRNRALASLAATTVLAVSIALASGWISYGMTNAALDRAKGNLTLGLEAFEEVFDALAGPDPSMALLMVEDGEDALAVPPQQISAEDAALLRSILAFYDRFAAANAGDDSLALDAARAHRRIGDIESRLGNRSEATTAYGKALDLFDDLPAERTASAAVRLEIAHTHTLLGEILGRRRQPRATTHYRTAFELAVAVVGAPDAPPGTRLVLARSERLYARALRREEPERAAGLLASAENRLLELVGENPDALAPRFELVLLLYRQARYRSPRTSFLELKVAPEQGVLLEDALVHGKVLVERPDRRTNHCTMVAFVELALANSLDSDHDVRALDLLERADEHFAAGGRSTGLFSLSVDLARARILARVSATQTHSQIARILENLDRQQQLPGRYRADVMRGVARLLEDLGDGEAAERLRERAAAIPGNTTESRRRPR